MSTSAVAPANPLPPFLDRLKRQLRQYPVHAVSFERGDTDADWGVQCWVDPRAENPELAAWNAAHGSDDPRSTAGICRELWDWWMVHAVKLITEDPQARQFLLEKVEGQRLGAGRSLNVVRER